MSKREGPDTGPEPKRARTNETVEVPDELLRTILRTTNLHDDEWDDLLEWLPKQSVDKLLPQLDATHYLRRLFEREQREKVTNELNSLGPTRLILNEDASELTLTLPESFQNIFEEPLQQKVTLRRSAHWRNENAVFDHAPIVRNPGSHQTLYSGVTKRLDDVFYFMKINPSLSRRFKKTIEYAQEFLRDDIPIQLTRRFGATFKFQSNLILKVTDYSLLDLDEYPGLEEYNDCLVVFFEKQPYSEPSIPLQEIAVADLRTIKTRISLSEGMYGNPSTTDPMRDHEQIVEHFTSWDLLPEYLSTWWQYAKDDPEEVVNAAAYRRQDLLGM